MAIRRELLVVQLVFRADSRGMLGDRKKGS